ncbi:MAG: hypothetical protein Q9198_011033 [Flavoplaca austrocitrina]
MPSRKGSQGVQRRSKYAPGNLIAHNLHGSMTIGTPSGDRNCMMRICDQQLMSLIRTRSLYDPAFAFVNDAILSVRRQVFTFDLTNGKADNRRYFELGRQVGFIEIDVDNGVDDGGLTS